MRKCHIFSTLHDICELLRRREKWRDRPIATGADLGGNGGVLGAQAPPFQSLIRNTSPPGLLRALFFPLRDIYPPPLLENPVSAPESAPTYKADKARLRATY